MGDEEKEQEEEPKKEKEPAEEKEPQEEEEGEGARRREGATRGGREGGRRGVYRLHTAFLHWPLSSAATKEVRGPDTT